MKTSIQYTPPQGTKGSAIPGTLVRTLSLAFHRSRSASDGDQATATRGAVTKVQVASSRAINVVLRTHKVCGGPMRCAALLRRTKMNALNDVGVRERRNKNERWSGKVQ